MTSRRLLSGLLAAALALALATCAVGSGHLTIELDSAEVRPDGMPAVLKLRGTGAGDTPLSGAAKLTGSCGALNGKDAAAGVEVWFKDGAAEATFRCDKAKHECCAEGIVTFELTAEKLAAKAAIRVGEIGAGKDAGGVPFVPPSSGNTGSVSTNGGGVFLYGTISEGTCGRDAVAAFNAPNRATIGWDCYARQHKLSTSGAIHYVLDGTIYRTIPDEFTPSTWDAKCWAYPFPPEKNDISLATCSSGSVADYLLVPESTEVVYRCRVGDSWTSTTGEAWVSKLETNGLKAIGRNHLVLTSGGDLINAAGERIDVEPILPTILHARAADSGFRVLVRSYVGSVNAYERWTIDAQGKATKEGVFATPPEGAYVSPSLMDGEGNAYGISISDDVIKFPLQPQTASVVYSESNTFPQDLCVTPPKIWVKIHGSYLITGP